MGHSEKYLKALGLGSVSWQTPNYTKKSRINQIK